MKHINLQIQILRELDAMKHNSKNYTRLGWRYGFYMDRVFFTDGSLLLIIPSDEVYILQAFQREKPMELPDLTMGEFEVRVSDVVRDLGNTRCRLFEINTTNSDNIIQIDEKYLKYFHIWDSKHVTFRGTNSRSPLYVFEDDVLMALILPVK